jgi:hypothetical protein
MRLMGEGEININLSPSSCSIEFDLLVYKSGTNLESITSRLFTTNIRGYHPRIHPFRSVLFVIS